MHWRSKISSGAVAALLTVPAGLAVAACGSSSSSSSSAASSGTATGTPAASTTRISVKPKTIAVLDVTDASESIQALNAIAAKELKALGWNAKFYNANGNPQTITQDATAIVNSHPDAVLNVSVDPSQMRPQLLALKQANIPVCAFTSGGSEAANSLYSVVPAEDEYHMGLLLGQYIAKTISAPKVIMLANPQNAAGIDREKGIDAGLKSNPNSKVVFRSVVDFANPATSAAQGVSAGLTKNPDANAIIPVFDFSTSPAVKAVQQGSTKAKVYGFYVASDTAPSLRMGAKSPIAAVVDNSTTGTTGPCLDQLLKHFEKGAAFVKYPLSLKTNAVPFVYDVVTPQNIGKLVPAGSTLQFTTDGQANPWIAQWAKDYPAK
jgi:ABC-type sugar transport system substrate-binding protein